MIYGIGNPLIDIIINVEEEDLVALGIHKGTMALIDTERMEELLAFSKGRDISYSCGGSAPNTIIALASLGVEVILAGKIGSDENGSIYRSRLQELSVGDQLTESSVDFTGSSVILVTPDSERSMNTYLGANRLYAAEDIDPKSVENAAYFHFTGYMWDTKSQQAAIMRALEIAKNHETVVSFDIADPFAVGRYREDFLRLIEEYCDIVFANREEARILFDNYDPYECCRSMGKLCSTAVVKNGRKGSYVSHNQEVLQIPVRGPVVPTDTTGAGDVYAAGFLYGCHQGHSAREAGIIASILAGEIITQRGAQFSAEKSAILREYFESGEWKE